jgi:hypothetical protein
VSKFRSRKFLTALAGFVTGVGLILGGATDAETIAGAVLSLASVIAYIFGEAQVDAASVKSVGATTEGEPPPGGTP